MAKLIYWTKIWFSKNDSVSLHIHTHISLGKTTSKETLKKYFFYLYYDMWYTKLYFVHIEKSLSSLNLNLIKNRKKIIVSTSWHMLCNILNTISHLLFKKTNVYKTIAQFFYTYKGRSEKSEAFIISKK